MPEQVLQEMVQKTDSSLIMFFVIILIMSVVFYIPLYRMQIKERKERTEIENLRQDKEFERQQQILSVITSSTEATTTLNATMHHVNEAITTALDKIDDDVIKVYGSISKLHERINLIPTKEDFTSFKSDIFEYAKMLEKGCQ